MLRETAVSKLFGTSCVPPKRASVLAITVPCRVVSRAGMWKYREPNASPEKKGPSAFGLRRFREKHLLLLLPNCIIDQQRRPKHDAQGQHNAQNNLTRLFILFLLIATLYIDDVIILYLESDFSTI